MRILILNHNARERGTYFRAFPFARELAERGHDVVFCCVQRDRMYRTTVERIDVDGDGSLVRYEMANWSGRQDSQEGRGWIDVARRCWLASSRRFDVVWAFSHKRNVVAPARLARLTHGATFVSDWCDRWGGEEGLFEDSVMTSDWFRALPAATRRVREEAFAQEAVWEESVRRDLADGVTAISRALEERALGLGVPRERLLRLHSGANSDAVRPLDKKECRRAFDLPPDATVLGYVANYNPDEALMLDALERVCSMRPHVIFAHGGASLSIDDAERKRRGLDGRMRGFGWIPDERFALFLGACDIMLLPLSDRKMNVERWPHKITDYLSAGRPVAANAVGDVADLLTADDAGAVGEPTGEGLAGAIESLLARRDEWDAIGARGRRTAESRLDWSALTDEALAFISSVREMGRR